MSDQIQTSIVTETQAPFTGHTAFFASESSEPEVKTQSETDSEPEVKTQSETDPEVKTQSETEPEVKTQSETDPEVTTAEDPAPEPEVKKKDGFEKRIERFERRLSEKDAEIAQLRRAIQNPQELTHTPQIQDLPEPTLAMFNNDVESFTKAHSAWSVHNALESMKAQQAQETARQTYQQREAQFKKNTPDFQEVIQEFTEDYKHANAPEISAYLADSELGPELFYYLATHTDETDRILTLSPHRRLAELGKIEARLETKHTPVKAPPKVSKAPAPITPEKGSAPTQKNLNDMKTLETISQAEYRKLRMAQRSR